MTGNGRASALTQIAVAATMTFAVLLVAGCAATPTASVTASLVEGGYTVQMVVKSDSTAIAAIEANANTYANDSGFAGVTFTKGDDHTAPHVCGFTVSNTNHTYQVDFYGNVKAGAGSEVCSAAQQTHFLATAP
jgi:hypothetical protein